MPDRASEARQRAERVLTVENSGQSSGLRPWAEDVLYLADRVAALETALREADEKLAECGTLLGRTANERDDLNDRLRVITVLCSYGYDLSFLDRMPLGSADEIGAYYGGELPEYVRTEIDAALAGGGGQTETPA